MKRKSQDFLVSKQNFDLIPHTEVKGLLQTHPSPITMTPYYDHPNYLSHQLDTHTFMSFIYNNARKYTIQRKWKFVQKHCAKQGLLLDYGSGLGLFPQQAPQSYTGLAFEPNQSARRLGEKQQVNYIDHWQNSKAYDVISLWHVLEHLSDPFEFLEKAYVSLKPGGHLIIALPNYLSYDAHYYAQYWAGWDVPRHLWHFSPPSLQQLADEKGFSFVSKTPMWLDAFYVSLLSEKYKHHQFIWPRALYRGILSNIKALKTKNFSSLIYLLQKRP